MSGALLTPTGPQRTFSMASVASTYSEFVVIYSFVSNLFFSFLCNNKCIRGCTHANGVNLYFRGTWSTLFSQGVFGILKLCNSD